MGLHSNMEELEESLSANIGMLICYLEKAGCSEEDLIRAADDCEEFILKRVGQIKGIKSIDTTNARNMIAMHLVHTAMKSQLDRVKAAAEVAQVEEEDVAKEWMINSIKATEPVVKGFRRIPVE